MDSLRGGICSWKARCEGLWYCLGFTTHQGCRGSLCPISELRSERGVAYNSRPPVNSAKPKRATQRTSRSEAGGHFPGGNRPSSNATIRYPGRDKGGYGRHSRSEVV